MSSSAVVGLCEGASIVELVRGVEIKNLCVAKIALGDAGEGSGWGEFQDSGDPERSHGVHALVPAHRMRNLLHDALECVDTVGDGGSVAVGQHRDAGLLGLNLGSGMCKGLDSWLHMHRVERAGDGKRHEPGAMRRVLGQGLELLDGARSHDLPGAVVVRRGQPRGLDGGEHLVSIASHDGGHAGWALCGRFGHSSPADCHQGCGFGVGDNASERQGGELSDGVASDETWFGVERACGGERGSDEEWLRDGRVADGFLVGIGAEVGKVQLGGLGELGERRREDVVLEPRGKEPGFLGALTRRNDC